MTNTKKNTPNGPALLHAGSAPLLAPAQTVVLATILAVVLLWPMAARAEIRLDCPTAVPEGEPFFARVVADEPILGVHFLWLDKEVPARLDWRGGGYEAQVLLGMGMKEKLEGDEHRLQAVVKTPRGDRILAQAVSRTPKAYPEEHLEVAKSYTSLSEENLARYERDKKQIIKARATLTPVRMYEFPFLRPVPGAVTSSFGFRRFFNGEPRSPHSGVDLRAAQGDPVAACASGTVILAADHFFSGNTVWVDHGQGVLSMYCHLSKMLVSEGQHLEQGEILGEIGSTGRVTGPHLHWSVIILGQLVDPLLLLGPGQ